MDFSPYSQNIYFSKFNEYDLTKDFSLYDLPKTLVDFSILVAGQISEVELVEEYNKAFEQDLDDLELLIISPEDAALKEKITLSNLGDKPIVGIIINKIFYYLLVKWKQSGKDNFFRKNLSIQFDVLFDSESNGGISL